MKKVLFVLWFSVSCLFAVSQASAQNTAKTPAETIDAAFKALKALDVKTFNQYLHYQDAETKRRIGDNILNESKIEQQKKLLQLIVQNLEYSISSQTVNDNNASVLLLMSNKDLAAILEEVLMASMNTGLNVKKDVKKQSVEYNAELVKIDGQWKIVMNDTLINAIFSGLFVDKVH